MAVYQTASLAPFAGLMPRRQVSKAGDAAREFEARVEPNLETMLRLAKRLGRDHAEDIVQDALARAWAKRGQFDPALGSFAAWILAITADQAYKTWRWHSRRDRPIAHEPRESQAPEVMLDLEASIRKLPDRQRLAVDCFYFAGLSIAETAAVMRCSEGTVKSTLFDARATLRELLR